MHQFHAANILEKQHQTHAASDSFTDRLSVPAEETFPHSNSQNVHLICTLSHLSLQAVQALSTSLVGCSQLEKELTADLKSLSSQVNSICDQFC